MGALMRVCYHLISNYGLAIVLFTIIIKVIMLPLAVWLHKNSIKIVKMQPSINQLHIDHFGDLETISELQSKLYKTARYNPLSSLLPLVIQVILLLGLVEVIYHPCLYLLQLPSADIDALVRETAALAKLDVSSASIELSVVEALKGYSASQAPELMELRQLVGSAVVSSVCSLQMDLFGLDVCMIPSMVGGLAVLCPIAAGASSLWLCIAQNRENVLQSEQGTWNKYGTMAFSVGLSLYLGWFVPVGVAIYWIVSNITAITQMQILNKAIDPKKYVDYEMLNRTREELRKLNALGRKRKLFSHSPEEKREKEDYKRFFSCANKHLVFYSEKSGFYKYYAEIIQYLFDHSNVVIHYVTNDSHDDVFRMAKEQPRLKPYYIGPKRIIPLMMKMDADIVVMTTPNLEQFHIKRSYVRDDVEYIYTDHGTTSTNMTVRKGAYDHFDTIFCIGQHQMDEIRETEAMYHLPPKTLVPAGFGLLDSMIRTYRQTPRQAHERKKVLIAPSWQTDNILDSCLENVLQALPTNQLDITIRPHPEYIKRYPERMLALAERYQNRFNEHFRLEDDFTSHSSVLDADVLITDWSNIAFEYSFTTLKPTLFINTPMKVINPEYTQYTHKPTDLTWRDQVGISIDPQDLGQSLQRISELLSADEYYRKSILLLREQAIFSLGHFGEITGKYLLRQLTRNREKKQ